MKIKYEFVFSEVEDETVAVSVGTEERNIIISLNESALFLWKLLMEDTSSEALTTAPFMAEATCLPSASSMLMRACTFCASAV